jgi:hypothetical protein
MALSAFGFDTAHAAGGAMHCECVDEESFAGIVQAEALVG